MASITRFHIYSVLFPWLICLQSLQMGNILRYRKCVVVLRKPGRGKDHTYSTVSSTAGDGPHKRHDT